ncbi:MULTISPECIES: anthranilate 1,2-dioxygenase ferredoxin subunit AndAb [Burkholderia]|uniref:Anthranilate 1,2-dioxygenase ferredoxin subunit AndAb n=2 Tax=Burkholderia cepacia complex TaxID=87882 RepID=A0ABZ3BR42_BURPY|nr:MULTISPECIES: anthranilate 1,2-dioxygenase ferredoxin subunit AndAb [Burkholderia]UXU90414.1 non-heme iron oxygenase ferredoxin subunit [Burkholderia sp. S-53]BAX62493.1 (2Fe-2S)-binding protein [Burkholderia stabilis]
MTEATLAEWHPLGAYDEFSEDEPAARVAGQKPIAVFRIGDELFAMHDLCTHGHARLSEGYVEDGCVECPLHQGLIDIRTGAPKCAPITEPVRTYPLRIVDGQVEVNVG